MSKRWGRILAGIVTMLSAPQKPWRRAVIRLNAAERLVQRRVVPTAHGTLVFVATHPQALEAARDFAEREPETLAWIDGFTPPCRFWDVGANIGVYSLYAALRPGVMVTAFEPAAANYHALCRNIEANRMGERIAAYCLALNHRSELGSLYLSATNPGSVYNAFEASEDCFGRPLAPVFRQGMLGFAIDGLRRQFGLPAPNYLKIDVDSIEERILAGAAETLSDPELRSVLIELEERDSARNDRLIGRLATAGLDLVERSAGNRGGAINGIFVRRT